MLGDMQEKC